MQALEATFQIACIFQACALIAIIGLTANLTTEIDSINAKPSNLLIGTITVTSVAAIYCIVTSIVFSPLHLYSSCRKICRSPANSSTIPKMSSSLGLLSSSAGSTSSRASAHALSYSASSVSSTNPLFADLSSDVDHDGFLQSAQRAGGPYFGHYSPHDSTPSTILGRIPER